MALLLARAFDVDLRRETEPTSVGWLAGREMHRNGRNPDAYGTIAGVRARVLLVLVVTATLACPANEQASAERGTTARGASCTASNDCATGLCNADGVCAANECPAGGCVDEKQCGVDECGTRCVDPLPPGEQCSETWDGAPCAGFALPCVDGAFCAQLASDLVGFTFGVCVLQASSGLGEPCLDDGDCIDAGHFCRLGRCEGCDETHPCDDGATCVQTCGAAECVPPVGVGEVCLAYCLNDLETVRRCEDGLECLLTSGSEATCESP